MAPARWPSASEGGQPVHANVGHLDLRPPGAGPALARRAAAWARVAGPAAVGRLVDRETLRWRCPVCGDTVPPELTQLGVLSPAEGGPPGLGVLLETVPQAPPAECWFGVHPGCAPATQDEWDALASQLQRLTAPEAGPTMDQHAPPL